jgi:8-oxo-dGTP pyrophosphatase MutT (NUDIX family)
VTTGRRSGDGWVECAQGHRHWGRYGAAGLLLHRPGDGRVDASGEQVLLQHRAEWSHHGGTWGLLGGARDPGEDPTAAALREAREESGLEAAYVARHGSYDDDHGNWSYVTVLAEAMPGADATQLSGESLEVRWIEVAEVDRLPLHPAFGAAWAMLRPAMRPVHVVVDVANVMGSRPDGWWRDRPSAAARVVAGCQRLADAGVAAAALPSGLADGALSHVWPRLTLVVEGAARAVHAPAGAREPQVRVIGARGSGDDTIVRLLRDGQPSGSRTLVVTADRELRRRCTAAGAQVVGPSWLLSLTDALQP